MGDDNQGKFTVTGGALVDAISAISKGVEDLTKAAPEVTPLLKSFLKEGIEFFKEGTRFFRVAATVAGDVSTKSRHIESITRNIQEEVKTVREGLGFARSTADSYKGQHNGSNSRAGHKPAEGADVKIKGQHRIKGQLPPFKDLEKK